MDIEWSLVGLGVFAILALLVARVTDSTNFPGFGLSPYLRFAYANFLKPHNGKTGDGQQGALESFYAAQVGTRASCNSMAQLRMSRLESTTPLGSVCFAVVKTCWP